MVVAEAEPESLSDAETKDRRIEDAHPKRGWSRRDSGVWPGAWPTMGQRSLLESAGLSFNRNTRQKGHTVLSRSIQEQIVSPFIPPVIAFGAGIGRGRELRCARKRGR